MNTRTPLVLICRSSHRTEKWPAITLLRISKPIHRIPFTSGSLKPMLLLHDDFKENSHVCLCCCRVKLFRCRFVDCRVCLTITDCGKPVRCNEAFVNKVCFDGTRPSFAQLLVVGFSAGSRSISCNTDFSVRLSFRSRIFLFRIVCASGLRVD